MSEADPESVQSDRGATAAFRWRRGDPAPELRFQPNPTAFQITVWCLHLVPVIALFLAPARRTNPATGAEAKTAKTG
ncbi:hypothetical protein ACFXPW_08510 [Streptomyces goshikiensis]|uniref:hypothetical protein n=1 Tax=Streptomyces goshikiensis TaxID=1942 RepID=UPI0036C4CCBF